MQWYVIHTKPRQEQRALVNLTRQGYMCYLPLLTTEKLRLRVLTLVQEPLFARYLFIHLDASQTGKSWAPIRSTQGVSRLVSFGTEPAKVDAELIESLRLHTSRLHEQPERLFHQGDLVQIKDGPFAGLEAVYQMADGAHRALVLIEFLSKPTHLTVSPGSLRQLA